MLLLRAGVPRRSSFVTVDGAQPICCLLYTSAWVPGKFMLTISEKEINDLAPKLIEKKLEAKLREVFDA